MRGSSQGVRHRDQVQSYLICSHPVLNTYGGMTHHMSQELYSRDRITCATTEECRIKFARACCIGLYAVLKIRGKKKREISLLTAAMKHCIAATRTYTVQTLQDCLERRLQ